MTSAPPSQPKESFCLIPIGETSTGKTTLINSFANYSRYATLDEAIESGPVVLSDVGFTYRAANVTGKPVYLRGSASEAKEEVDVSGVTHTQGGSVYSIDSNDSEELIFYDNPGFGSQSLLQKEKFKKPIHAIFIVLKPDETRLHTELRTFLETEGKILLKNIVYCFTNTRAHSFQPAATLTALRDFLQDLEGTVRVEFSIKKENIFCFENDCFRYLCYLAANPEDQSRHHSVYAKEWTTNVEEYKRLISHVKTLTPILHEKVRSPGIAMEPTDFRDLLPDPRRAVVDLLIEQKKWPVLKGFISTESQEVQQAFDFFMKSAEQSGDQALIRSLPLPSEETLAAEFLLLELVNEIANAKKKDTEDDSKFTISNITDLHVSVRQGDEKLAQSLIDKGVDVNGEEAEPNFTPLHVAVLNNHVDTVELLLEHKATIDNEDKDLSTPLHLAAQDGHEQVVGMLLGTGTSISSKEKVGWTPLHIASNNNHIENAIILFKNSAPILLVLVLVLLFTWLHFAAKSGRINKVELLLQHEAIIDSKGEDLPTLLHIAACYGDNLMIEKLIRTGASVSSKNKNGWTPLHFAARNDHIENARTLLKHRAPIDAGTLKNHTPLHLAVQHGHVDMVNFLLQHGAIVDSYDYSLCTPLHLAARGHHLIVKRLITAGASVTSKNRNGWTPLHFAARYNHIKCARTLLKHRAPIDAGTMIGCIPLHWAAQKGHVDMVKLLLQHGAIVDSEDNDHDTPLHFAARHGRHLVVEMLITAGASVFSKDKYKWTPLHFAARNDHIESARTLLKHRAPIDAVTDLGRTPLHFAAQGGHKQMVKLLLDENADLNVPTSYYRQSRELSTNSLYVDDIIENSVFHSSYSPPCRRHRRKLSFLAARKLYVVGNAINEIWRCDHSRSVTPNSTDGWTPLHFAVQGGHELMVRLLLNENANPDACDCNGQTPLHIACRENMIEVVKLLLQYKATIEVTDNGGRSPLQLASFEGAVNCVTYLLKRGANSNTADNNGQTALYNAADANHVDIVKILIQYGVNVDARCFFLESALHIASFKGNVDTVTLLLQAGANPNRTNEDNETPLQIAQAEGHYEVAVILMGYRAR